MAARTGSTRHNAAVLLLRCSGGQIRSIARVITAVAALAVFVIGWWGWYANRGTTTTEALDIWTTTYRTFALFVFDSSGAPPGVSPQLQFARLAAPVVLAVSAVALLVATARSWATAVAARWSSAHRVVIGPFDLDGSEMLKGGLGGSTGALIVHVVDTTADIERCSESHLHVTRTEGWPRAAGVGRAAEIMISTPSDSLNLEVFAAVADYRETNPNDSDGSTARILVSIDDHPTAVDVAVLLARRTVIAHPSDRADVLDRSYDLASAVADFLADGTAVAPDRFESVLIGTSRFAETLVHCAVESLWQPFVRANAVATCRLWLVGSRSSSLSTAWCEVTTVADLSELERLVGADASLRIAAVDDDSNVAVEHALASASRFPNSQVRCASDLGPFTATGLMGFDLRSRRPDGLLERTARTVRPDPDQIEAHGGATAATDAGVREIIDSLSHDHLVVSLEQVPGCLREFFLPSRLTDILPNAVQLPGRLAHLGIAVVRRPAAPVDGFKHLTPEQVEVLAERVHENYIANERAHMRLESGQRDTHRSWSELDPATKALSRAQIQSYPELLSLIGYELTPLKEALGRQIDEIPEELIETAARREHDRWAEYTSRTRPNHPNLVGWDHLSHEDREKDRNPVRALPMTMALVGLAVVKRSAGG